MLREVIIQELHVIGGEIIELIPFICAFYGFEFPLFYSHRNLECDVIVIPFAMGTCQNDSLERALFTLVHFKALHFIANYFLSFLFPCIVDDIHIISPPSIVLFAYGHFQTKFHAIGFSIQPKKCVAWSPFGLPPDFNTPLQFNTPSKGIKV